MENVGIYPGTFDPITNGHKSIAERASKIFSRLIVAVVTYSPKQPLFCIEERCALAKKTFAVYPNIEVVAFSGLLVEYAQSIGCTAIVRGLRALNDFEYEFQLALANRKLAPNIETIFLMTDEASLYISSSLVKSIAELGGCVDSFVPPHVAEQLKRHFVK